MLKHVLVPLDGSDLAARALDYAQSIVGQGGEITLLTAVDPPEYVAYSMYGAQAIPPQTVDPHPNPEYSSATEEIVRQSRQYLDSIAIELERGGWKVHRLVAIGSPAELIIQATEEAEVDAIVMSTHGRSGISRWILGSITNKVLSAAPCPVFVVPPKR